jgi:hypothetical protein
MPGGKTYTKDELSLLEKDAQFNLLVSEDEILHKLFHNYNELEEREESLQSLGIGTKICGVIVPPPTLGHIRLLKIIDSPFVSQTEAAKDKFVKEPYNVISDSLYILCNGEESMLKYSTQFTLKRKIDYYLTLNNDEKFLKKLIEAEREVAQELVSWELMVSKWCNDNNVKMQIGEDVVEVSKKISNWISLSFTGFNLFPKTSLDNDVKNIKHSTSWDSEHEASILSLVNVAAPGTGIKELRWDMPLNTVGYLCASGARKNGAKGIGKKPRAEECFDRLNALMDEALIRIKG